MEEQSLSSLHHSFHSLSAIQLSSLPLAQACAQVRQLFHLCALILSHHSPDAASTLQTTSSVLSHWQQIAKSQLSIPPEAHPTRLHVLLCTLWADFHREQSEHSLALKALRKALTAAQLITPVAAKRLSKAKVLLNLAAIHSDMQATDKTLQRAQKALRLIQKDLKSAEPDDAGQEIASVAAQALYAIGVAEEAQGRKEAAETAFKAGEALGRKYLPAENDLLKLLFATDQSPREPIILQPLSSNSFRAFLKSRTQELQTAYESRLKYYSDTQLKTLEKHLDTAGEGPRFLSSDQYFKRKITKAIGPTQPVPTAAIPSTLEDRKRVNTLRARRKPPPQKISLSTRGAIHVKEELFQLSVQAKETAYKNEVRRKSHSRTKAFRATLTSIAKQDTGERSLHPPQSEC